MEDNKIRSAGSACDARVKRDAGKVFTRTFTRTRLIITHFTHSVILPGIFADILIPVQDEES